MKTWTLAIATILFCSTIGGCLSESNDDTEDKITNLENSQAELALELDEQKQIVSYLDEKTRKIDSLISQVELQISELQEFRESLISSAVTGKIKVAQA